MYVVIIGCGRVGAELARLLSTEGHNVVVIDHDEERFSRLGDAFNGITIKGNGVSTKVLQEAGIEKTDVFCALTNSDNINIMASQVAKGIFKVPRVIARIYDPQRAHIYKTLGLDILSETVLFASLIRDKIVDPMLSGFLIETEELGVLEFPVAERSLGKTVAETNIPGELMITAIRRPKRPVIIPEAKTLLAKGDTLVAVVKMASVPKIKNIFSL
ncbi:MAG TPA: TrkA family potassium uptake protein [Candidatus Omnitrophota bacterium]|nr:TrkA family potassium uptake protein [Candidatus Omnitrophota bacterium]HPD84576.1 TrkA family potassium uptake protein [Candidatus Omnitrophota bacterium]HRZ03434.1 TrkA family potassium uptake protein [Candidatus Omnitrophota bacterium]